MCEPTSIMAAATVVSGLYQAQVQRKQGAYQRGVARYNARVSENQAEEVRRAGVDKENAKRREVARLVSKQRAQLGASNVDIGSGSALQLQEDAQTFGEIDALRIRDSYSNRADALDTSAALTSDQGDYAYAAGRNAAIGTLLSTTANTLDTGVADKWFTPESAANSVTSTVTPDDADLLVGNLS